MLDNNGLTRKSGSGHVSDSVVLTPEGWRYCRHLRFDDGMITRLDLESQALDIDDIDPGIKFLLPGIVDIHGDAFERHITPRVGTQFPLDLALASNDHSLTGAGITSFFYSITDGFEPGPRSRATVRALLSAIERLRPRLRCNSYIHIRHETVNTDDHEELRDWIAENRIDLLSLNNHLPPADNDERKLQRYLAGLSRRVSMTNQESRDFIQSLQGKRDTGEAQVRELCALAHACEIPLASHDDSCQQDVERSQQRGVAIAEFPMSLALASALRERHIAVVLGAPNLVRGGSHVGGLSVDEALRFDQVDAICSDYHYPSLFHAPFLMETQGLRPLSSGWKLVSEYPASAVGLGSSKGRLVEGYDADMLMLDNLDGSPLSINTVFAKGRVVLQRDDCDRDAILYRSGMPF